MAKDNKDTPDKHVKLTLAGSNEWIPLKFQQNGKQLSTLCRHKKRLREQTPEPDRLGLKCSSVTC